MNSHRTVRFLESFARLPSTIQEQARAADRLFEQNSWHPSLHFKRISKTRTVDSVRIGRGYRALGFLEEDTIVWFWIGSHAEYDQLIRRQ